MRAFGASGKRGLVRVQAAVGLAVVIFAIIAHGLFFYGKIQVLYKPAGAIDFLDLVLLAITTILKNFKHRAARRKFLLGQD